ncbi:MAG: thioesterase family protein [Sphingomonadales bacterium]|nr:thioesterase family protein [Sphingomonadales bacterium]
MNMALPGRLDRTAMAAATYPATISMPVRFDDLDVLWHVNNAAVIVMLQEARVFFPGDVGLPKLDDYGVRSVVAGMIVEYADELTHPGPLAISTGILRLGATSFTMAQLIRQDGKPCVYAAVTLVGTDANGATALPQEWRRTHEARGMLRWDERD